MSEINKNITQLLDPGQNIPCSRCKTNVSVLISRKENFCKDCFIKFIRTKQRKQMQDEKFKVKYGANCESSPVQKVLLTLSFGSSSLVLLDAIISVLNEQLSMHRGKQGFELVVVNFNEYQLNNMAYSAKSILAKLGEFLQPVKFTTKVLNLDSFIVDKSLLKQISVSNDFSSLVNDFQSRECTFKDLLDRCGNKSSREDMLNIIYERMALRTAFVEGCETIVFGHCMTRLANEIIALTVKGRGSIVSEKISDRFCTYQEKQFNIIYPLREVLQSEIEQYLNLNHLDQFVNATNTPKSTITKNMTIKDLITQYFNTLEATGYESVASTVVKTGDKLTVPTSNSTTHCRICHTILHKDPKEWLRTITVNTAAPLTEESELQYLEEFRTAFPESLNPAGSSIDLCYGCIVTIGGERGFIWPVQPSTTKEGILNEYILTDDEDDEEI